MVPVPQEALFGGPWSMGLAQVLLLEVCGHVSLYLGPSRLLRNIRAIEDQANTNSFGFSLYFQSQTTTFLFITKVKTNTNRRKQLTFAMRVPSAGASPILLPEPTGTKRTVLR